jgi:arsenical-resistance protein 2
MAPLTPQLSQASAIESDSFKRYSTMSEAQKNWYDAFPVPKSRPAEVSPEILKEMMDESAHDEDTGFVVVDVRRNDYTESAIPGSVNIPAQTFYLGLATWAKIFGDRTVIFHCNSSKGRGTRCAAWYDDHLETNKLEGQSAILTGGIIAWRQAYPDCLTKIPEEP